MSQTTLPPDALDDALSDFFKSKMRTPWPAAPIPAEPSGLLAARNRTADNGNRARVTLAASVAILVGTCWYFSSGLQTGDRGAAQSKPDGPKVLPSGTATLPKEFEKSRENKAKNTKDPMIGFQPPPIHLP